MGYRDKFPGRENYLSGYEIGKIYGISRMIVHRWIKKAVESGLIEAYRSPTNRSILIPKTYLPVVEKWAEWYKKFAPKKSGRPKRGKQVKFEKLWDL